MNISEILTHEAGIIERLIDTTDASMVDDIQKLFAEVRRLRVIEDAARKYERSTFGKPGLEAYANLAAALRNNPRQDSTP